MENQVTVKKFFESPEIIKHMSNALGEKSNVFRTSVLGIVNSNANLQKCEPSSIYHCALLATTLDLAINPNLGLAWIIPYGNKAQFQIGYKGFIQLAQRSGKFLSLNSVAVYENDTDEDVRKRLTSFLPQKSNGNIIGYCAYFKLLNGYEQSLPMSIDELKKHGQKYSKSFNGLWTTDFEAMARKTVLKLLLQRYAPMSVEMQKAELADQGVIKNAETLDIEYIDNSSSASSVTSIEEVNLEKERNRMKVHISKITNKKDLIPVFEFCEKNDLMEIYNSKLEELKNRK